MPNKRHRSGPTSIDVARRAGVSQAAVSYVLNGIQDKRVSAESQAKILQAAQELGYSIHPVARSLRTGKSEEIGIIADLPASFHQMELSQALQQQAFAYELTPVLYFSHGLLEEQRDALFRRIFARRPLGLIATGQSMTEARVVLARQMGIEHIVLISSQPASYAHTIVLPVREAGYLAAQHFLARGHTHLGLLRPEDPFTESGFLLRLEGMRAALAESGRGTLEILPMQLSPADAYALVTRTLTSAGHPTGIYAYNDEYALPLLDALIDQGIRIPQEIAVLGTDNIAFGGIMRPTLSTISLGDSSIGRRVIDLLVALHRGESPSAELTRPLEPQLLPRAST
jgi:LacI family transcriptional regulator